MQSVILATGVQQECCERIADHFSRCDCRLEEVAGWSRLLATIARKRPRLVVLGSTGENLDDAAGQIRRIRGAVPMLPVILISQQSSEAHAVAAFRAGASDYFKTPVPYPLLLRRMAALLEAAPSMPGSIKAEQAPESAPPLRMIGDSPVMRAMVDYLVKVAATSSTVLITGESGTGKELAAQLIHHHSARSDKPLVAVNCAALPESLAESELFGHERGAFTGAAGPQKGKFALANGGTIFLDEIGDMNPAIQAKILHTIERKVIYPLGGHSPQALDVRIIAATNQNPEKLIEEGRFRQDLFYRLNVARVNLVPLRHRTEDIPALVTYAIDELNRRFNRCVAGLTPEAMAFLKSHDWPGNVRELMNLLEATYINLPQEIITHADLPPYFLAIISNTRNYPVTERRAIVSALLKTNWNKSRAAQELNWSRMTLYRKIAQYRIVQSRNR